jgi:hypothetical protein
MADLPDDSVFISLYWVGDGHKYDICLFNQVGLPIPQVGDLLPTGVLKGKDISKQNFPAYARVIERVIKYVGVEGDDEVFEIEGITLYIMEDKREW